MLGQRNGAIVTLIMHDGLQLGGPSNMCFRTVDCNSIETGVSGAFRGMFIDNFM